MRQNYHELKATDEKKAAIPRRGIETMPYPRDRAEGSLLSQTYPQKEASGSLVQINVPRRLSAITPCALHYQNHISL